MDFDDFENKVISKLETDITDIEVRSYPDDFDNYISQLTHPNGAILVVFQGGLWEPPEGNNQKVLTQQGQFNWQFTVLQQNLATKKNQTGIYDKLEEIRQSLSGWTPAGFDDSSVLFPVDVGFLDKIKGFYVYQITFGHHLEESEA